MNRFGRLDKKLIVKNLEPTTLDAHSCGHHQVDRFNHDVVRPKGRIDYQLIYITEGLGHFEIDGREIDLMPGTIVLYPPNTPQFYNFIAEEATSYYWLHFVGAKNHMELGLLFDKGPKVLTIGHNPSICNALECIIDEFNSGDDFHPQICNHYLYTILLTILRHENKSTKPSSSIVSAIHDTANYMRTNYAKKYTLQDYAAYNNLSVSRFIHNFETVFNLAPMKYLRKIRLENACWLLINTIHQISDISLSVGYEDPLYFSRVFKKEHGVSPSVYRSTNQ